MRAHTLDRLGLAAAGLALTSALSACGGPTLADLQADEVSMTVTSVASDSSVATAGDSAGGLGVTRAFLSASSVTLLPCLSDASDLELGARGYELLQDPPMTERVTTAVLELCGLRVDIDPVAASASDDLAKGTTLYLEGQDAAGNAFSVSSSSSLSLFFAPESGASFGDQPLLLGFDLSLWLAGLPVTDEPKASSALLDSQLLDAAALYVDGNGNGALEADEMTPVARARASR